MHYNKSMNLLQQQMLHQEPQDIQYYYIILTLRRIELSIGSIILLFIFLSILLRKIYVYNTIRLFMFVCIFDFFGILSALVFDKSYASGDCPQILKKKNITVFMNEGYDNPSEQIKCTRNFFADNSQDNGQPICGIEAFFNLFCYALSYFFAVLISYNVYCVLKDKHKHFMRKIFTQKTIIAFLVLLLCLYLLPLIFVYIKDVNVSYGPAGFRFHQNNIFFCGIFNKSEEDTAPYLFLVFSLLGFTFLQFIVHLLILWRVRYRISKFLDVGYMNSKQKFLVRSGNIGGVIFLVQLINFVKETINALSDLETTLLIINFIFDLYPVILLVSYIYYTRLHDEQKTINETFLSLLNS